MNSAWLQSTTNPVHGVRHALHPDRRRRAGPGQLAREPAQQVGRHHSEQAVQSFRPDQKLLRLKQDVKLTYFDKTDSFARAKDLLDRYETLSTKLRVDYVDPDKKPQLARIAWYPELRHDH